MKEDVIHLIFCHDNAQVWYSRSGDNGQSRQRQTGDPALGNEAQSTIAYLLIHTLNISKSEGLQQTDEHQLFFSNLLFDSSSVACWQITCGKR